MRFSTGKNVLLSVFGLAVAWFFAVSIPLYLADRDSDVALSHSLALRSIGWIIILFGAFVFIWCYVLFISVGKGTPWHFDPPKELVIAGPYAHVRNPMECSLLMIILGQCILFLSKALVFYLIVSFLVLHARQILVDEPALRKRFGAAYDRYVRSVPRWIPRFTPYKAQSWGG